MHSPFFIIFNFGRTGALRWLWLALAILGFDQWTKLIAVKNLVLHQPVPIIPGLNLTLTHNMGAAFSFLSSETGWQRWLFIIIAILLSLLFVYWMKKLEVYSRYEAISIAMVLGGALGNLWDRIYLGYVIDFVQVYYKSWSWPVFNLADSAITIGVFLLIFGFLFKKQEKRD